MKFKDMPKLPLVLIALMFAIGAWVYPHLPARIPTHWNAMGQIDGWSTTSLVSVFAEPLMALGMYGLFLVMPYLDPRRDNIIKSKDVYSLALNLVTALFFAMYIAGLVAAFDRSVPVGDLTQAGVGLMFIVLGNYMGRVKTNWTIGVRTAWTLSDDTVWLKTNRLGGRLFMLVGAISILAVLLPAPWDIAVLLASSVAILPILYAYSMRLHRALHPE